MHAGVICWDRRTSFWREKRGKRERKWERWTEGGLENYTFEVHLRIYLQKSQSRKGRKDAFLLRIFHLAIHKSDSNTTFFFPQNYWKREYHFSYLSPKSLISFSDVIICNALIGNYSFLEKWLFQFSNGRWVLKVFPFLEVITINFDHTDRDDESEQNRNE